MSIVWAAVQEEDATSKGREYNYHLHYTGEEEGSQFGVDYLVNKKSFLW